MRNEGAAFAIGNAGAGNDLGVTWVQSYASEDKRSTFCVYEGPNADTVRAEVEGAGQLVERITKVSVLNYLPVFFR